MSLRTLQRADRTGNRAIQAALDNNVVFAEGTKEGSVKWVERMLEIAGFKPGKRDASFTAGTAKALSQFQAARGIPVTGQLDERTFAHLKTVQGRVRNFHGQDVFSNGQRGDEVLAAEKRLRALGYSPGRVDGIFDAETNQALKAFKADENNLGKMGLLGERAQKALGQETRSLQHAPYRARTTKNLKQHRRLNAATAKAAERTNADGTKGLGLGDKGRAVKNVQARLRQAGFDPSRTDGVMDERTVGALKAFQKKAGLEPTGRVTPRTWNELNDSLILAKSGTSPAQEIGERSGAVKDTEQLLRKLGYKKVKADGVFDKATARAVRAFEKKHKLERNGEVSTDDLKKLRKVAANDLGKGKRVTGFRNGSAFTTKVYPVGNGEYLQKNAAINYKKMVLAAKRAGIPLSSTSGFRTMAEQQRLWVQFGMNPNRVARPGFSNHQQGLSMDIGGVGGFGTRAFNWLRANAGRFGFVNDVAGEFWHWTYKR
jgi:peptidoglycan hydrolase-like protein with peptidoglycan-binding domain